MHLHYEAVSITAEDRLPSMYASDSSQPASTELPVDVVGLRIPVHEPSTIEAATSAVAPGSGNSTAAAATQSPPRPPPPPPPVPRTPDSKSAPELYKAVYDFKGFADKLSLKVGDIVELLQKNDNGWWTVRRGTQVGLSPFNYLERVLEINQSDPIGHPPAPARSCPVETIRPVQNPPVSNGHARPEVESIWGPDTTECQDSADGRSVWSTDDRSISPSPHQPRPYGSQLLLQPLKKRSITIILVGETGVGKTTFMSLLANVCAGIPLNDLDSRHNRDNENAVDRSQSQTKTAMLYEIMRVDGVLVRVLDTPGLCDTRGIEQDTHHKASIAEAVRNEIDKVDAVIIMANGTNERLSVATDYALTTLSAMFPASIVDNIGFLFTMVDSPLSFNFQTTSLPVQLQEAELWTLQNPLAMISRLREMTGRESQKKVKHFNSMLRTSFDNAVETLDSMFVWADEKNARPTADIARLYDMTQDIEIKLTGVLARMHQQNEQREDLIRLKHKMEKNTQEMEINRQYESIMKREMNVQIPTPNTHTTQCTVHDCYSNCHKDCHLDFLLDYNEIGRRCTAFNKRQSCKVCHHSYKDHRHFHSYWGKEIKQQKITDEAAKQRYEEGRKFATDFERQEATVEASIKQVDEEIAQNEQLLGELCDSFQALALSGSFTGQISAIIRLLEMRLKTKKATGEHEVAKALEKRIARFKQQLQVLERAKKMKRSGNTFLVEAGNATYNAVRNYTVGLMRG